MLRKLIARAVWLYAVFIRPSALFCSTVQGGPVVGSPLLKPVAVSNARLFSPRASLACGRLLGSTLFVDVCSARGVSGRSV
jgi:hypothetical protein